MCFLWESSSTIFSSDARCFREKNTIKFCSRTGTVTSISKDKYMASLIVRPSIYWLKCWKKIPPTEFQQKVLWHTHISSPIWTLKWKASPFIRPALLLLPLPSRLAAWTPLLAVAEKEAKTSISISSRKKWNPWAIVDLYIFFSLNISITWLISICHTHILLVLELWLGNSV